MCKCAAVAGYSPWPWPHPQWPRAPQWLVIPPERALTTRGSCDMLAVPSLAEVVGGGACVEVQGGHRLRKAPR